MSINSFDILYKFNYACKMKNEFIRKNNEKYRNMKMNMNLDMNMKDGMNLDMNMNNDSMSYMFLWL